MDEATYNVSPMIDGKDIEMRKSIAPSREVNFYFSVHSKWMNTSEELIFSTAISSEVKEDKIFAPKFVFCCFLIGLFYIDYFYNLTLM